MDKVSEVRSWVEQHDASLYRTAPLEVEELRDSGNGIPGSYAIKGLAAVYRKWSLDLGGFRERILPGAFDRVLGEDPHVIHTWDHDTARALSSTRSKQYPLELKSQRDGLGFYSRVAPTTDAQNLRILMEGGVIDQSSFAFTVREGEWRFLEEEDIVERDIVEVDGLFDVTTCALGAYPQTDSEIAVRSLMRGEAFRRTVYFPGTATSTTGWPNATVLVAQDFGTRSSGADGSAEPEEQPAPAEPVEPPIADPTPDEEGGEQPASSPEPAAASTPEAEEARAREFDLWKRKKAAAHRRTREFVYGVEPTKEDT